MTVQMKSWITGLSLAALSLAPSADAQQKLKAAVADDIFADHPSMDKNATVMPAPDAKPVAPVFSERPIGDASIARLPGGGWILTGTSLRTGARHGVELWTSPDSKKWTRIGSAKISGEGIAPGDVSERYLAPSATVAGDKLYLAFSDKTGCARVATGRAAQPGGAFRASPCLVEVASDVSLFVD